jgi:type I restriction enzyme S subunit
MTSAPLQQTDLGLLPPDWSVSTVGAEFHVELGKMLDQEKNVGLPKPFLGNRSVQWGKVVLDDIGQIRLTAQELPRFRLRYGDLLVCEGGEVGRSAIWRDELPECYYQKALHRLRAKSGYRVELMAAVLERYSVTGRIQDYVTQTSIAHLPKDKFLTLPIPVPANDGEQAAIAQALTDADSLIDSLEQLLTKQRQVKQGAMQELLTGKRRLPGFAGAWNRLRVEDVALIDPESLGADTDPDYLFNYISLESVNEGSMATFAELSFAEAPSRARRVLKRDDVLISTVRPSLKSHLLFTKATGNWVASTGFCIVRCAVDRAAPPFVFALAFSDVFQQQIDAVLAGSNYPSINSSDVRRLEFDCPGLAEQHAIAQVLTDMDASLTALQARLTKARQLKQALMQVLLTGRIRLLPPGAAAAGASPA